MSSSPPRPLTAAPGPALDVARSDMPVSTQFDDVYFSVEGGLKETRDVYLKACGLPQRWEARERFVIGELGFGSGLNFLATWQMWQQSRPSASARLHFVSIEGFPFDSAQLEAALKKWPELAEFAAPLIRQWPGRVKGIHRLEFEGGLSLTLCHDDVSAALADLSLRADAWFLDGFSPAKNPQMWTPDVMQSVFDLSAPGAKIGTFTVAGDVRRALTAAGFETQKLPGFGRKRHRLEAVKSGAHEQPGRAVCPIIIGAGIAGAGLARSFVRRGIAPIIIDPDDGSEASGNPAAIVKPRLDLQDRPQSRFFAAAYLYARAAYAGKNVIRTGVAHIAKTQKEEDRFQKLASQTALPAQDMRFLTARDMAERTGLRAEFGGLWFARAPVIDPVAMRRDWTAGAQIIKAEAASLTAQDGGCDVTDDAGKTIASGTDIFICAGAKIESLWPQAGVRYQRGQVTLCDKAGALTAPVTYGGYAVPMESSVLLGATHERGAGDDPGRVRDADNDLNKAGFAAMGGASGAASGARSSVRVTTADTFPMAGAIAPGLHVMTGLGGRGFVHAPLIAESLVSAVCNDPLPVAQEIMTCLSPSQT